MNDIYSILPDYYKHRIAVVGKRNFFIRYRDSLVECISRYGFDVKAYAEVEDALLEKPTCVVVIAPTLYSIPKDKSIIWIMVQTEQLFNGAQSSNSPFLNTHIKELKPYLDAYDIILDESKQNIAGLVRVTKTPVVFFPSGWHPSLEINKAPNISAQEKPYDLLFVGNMPGVDQRRKKLVEFLATKYKVYPIRNDLWGNKKFEALSSSKICLNIHYDETRYMETARLNDYFANNCFVLSEPMHQTEPFVEGRDFVEFFWTNICEKIDYYLLHEEERDKIANQGYKTLCKHTFYDNSRILIDNLIMESYNRYQAEKYKNNNTVLVRIKRLLKNVLGNKPV